MKLTFFEGHCALFFAVWSAGVVVTENHNDDFRCADGFRHCFNYVTTHLFFVDPYLVSIVLENFITRLL